MAAKKSTTRAGSKGAATTKTRGAARKRTSKVAGSRAAERKPTTKKRAARSTSAASVKDYLGGLHDWQGRIVGLLRDIVRREAPNATEAIRWAQPVFALNGPFAYIRPGKEHVTFGFWRGAELDAPRGVLEGTGGKMRHVKLNSHGNVGRDILERLVRQAAALNLAKGNPTRS
jgi:hypothetical protein